MNGEQKRTVLTDIKRLSRMGFTSLDKLEVDGSAKE